MKHKDKIKIARKLLTHAELKKGVPIFQSVQWIIRLQAIKDRISKQRLVNAYKRKMRNA